MTMRFMNTLHPSCIFFFFVSVTGITLACHHPIMVVVSLGCAALYLGQLKGGRAAGKALCLALLTIILVGVINAVFNHRGVTQLFMLFNQSITLEAFLYGLVSGCQFTAIILWFASYQQVVTSDKFLYLFGKIAPSAALLVTMTLRLIPQIRAQLGLIRESQQMLRAKPERIFQKMHTVIRHLSTLLTWSMENAMELADSMKARGFGIRRRTNFHLFCYTSRDVWVQGVLALFCGICILGRCFGHGSMEFYPRMSALFTGESGMTTYFSFALLSLTPTLLEIKEAIHWRSYGLIH